LFGLLSGLFLALLGFQKLAKKQAGIVNVLEDANAADAAIADRSRLIKREELAATVIAHTEARRAEQRAHELAEGLRIRRITLASEVSDEDALKEINRE
jgi:hypothetical protein